MWLSTDPLADQFANMSPYAYAANNPALFTDRWGLAPDPPAWWKALFGSGSTGNERMVNQNKVAMEVFSDIIIEIKPQKSVIERVVDFFSNHKEKINDGSGLTGTALLIGESAGNQVKRDILLESRELKKVTIENRSAFNTTKKLTRITGYAGKALGVYGTLSALVDVIDEPNKKANWLKLVANGGMLALKANPWTLVISVGYTVLDEGGYIDDALGE